jgi:hypothetical protein
MKLPQRMAGGAGAKAKPVFRVVMAYDDFTAGKRAIDTCNFLVSRIGGSIELRSSMWKFDVLRSIKLHQIAVDDAIEADVIIVANARESGLPEEVKEWVNSWVSRKGGQAAALVALLDFTGEDTREPTQAYAFLKGAASTARIDFLPQEIRSAKNRMPYTSKTSFLHRHGPGKDPLMGRPSPEAWGIND